MVSPLELLPEHGEDPLAMAAPQPVGGKGRAGVTNLYRQGRAVKPKFDAVPSVLRDLGQHRVSRQTFSKGAVMPTDVPTGFFSGFASVFEDEDDA